MGRFQINEKNLQGLRPSLDLDPSKSNDTEAFQNKVLRPIIKMQHHRIMEVIQNHPNYRHKSVAKDNFALLHKAIITFIQKNPDIKNIYIGMSIAMMTQEEYETFITEKRSLSKRLISIIAQRIADTLAEELGLID